MSNWLLLRQAFRGSNLANVEVLLLVFCCLDGPNTCPFGSHRWQRAIKLCVCVCVCVCDTDTLMMCVFSSRQKKGLEATLWVCHQLQLANRTIVPLVKESLFCSKLFPVDKTM